MAVVLGDLRLEILARVIGSNEKSSIGRIQFGSEQEAAGYLIRNCEATWPLLESGRQLGHEFQGNNVKAPIAHEICSYLEMGFNFALQGLRNYEIRISYITKIRDHADDMIMSLLTMDNADVAAAEQLAESATAFKNCMLKQHEIMRSPFSQAFSAVLHQNGTTFQQLVNTHHQQTFWDLREAPFQSLTDNQKIRVYSSIIEASGQGSPLENLMSRDLGPAGTEFLLFTAGMLAWGVFSSRPVVDAFSERCPVVDAALAKVINRGFAPGGALLEQALGVDVPGMLADSDSCVVMAGILTGSDGAVVIGTFVSSFVETFITSGGHPEIVTTNLHYYVFRTFDGVALARKIYACDENLDWEEVMRRIIRYWDRGYMVS